MNASTFLRANRFHCLTVHTAHLGIGIRISMYPLLVRTDMTRHRGRVQRGRAAWILEWQLTRGSHY